MPRDVGLAEETGALELLRQLPDCDLDVRGAVGSGADQLSASEEQDDHVRVLDAADETGELLGLGTRPGRGRA